MHCALRITTSHITHSINHNVQHLISHSVAQTSYAVQQHFSRVLVLPELYPLCLVTLFVGAGASFNSLSVAPSLYSHCRHSRYPHAFVIPTHQSQFHHETSYPYSSTSSSSWSCPPKAWSASYTCPVSDKDLVPIALISPSILKTPAVPQCTSSMQRTQVPDYHETYVYMKLITIWCIRTVSNLFVATRC